jgi:oxygen-dependent protoporphyrinogen oxidase
VTERVDLAVVGAGISGLAAAWEAQRRGATVVVVDAADRPGGKLRTSPLAGVALDESADAFLARVPDALDLCRELGIEHELVAPATGRAYVWSRGALRVLPSEQLLGVPTDLDAVARSGILSPEGLARARRDLAAPPPGNGDGGGTGTGTGTGDGDEAVGALVRRRLGDEVLDRLVGPLVGGIWAGDCDRLSLEVTTPALAEARQRDPSLIRGAAALRPPARNGAHPDPVFLTPRDGMGRLVDALVAALGDRVRLRSPVARIDPEAGGGTAAGSSGPGRRRWRLAPLDVVADAVVVATPAFAAAPLLAPHSSAAARTLAAVEHASIAMVSLAVPRTGIDHPLDGSGFLVPPTEGRMLTACSWASSKWAHLAGDGSLALLRCSAGRDGDPRALARDDAALVQALRDDLRVTLGLHGDPVATRVTRWPRSFPQPRPGHLARVAAVEEALARDAPGLAVAGAWMRGVGIPACVRAGRRAAADLLSVGSSTPR